MFQDHASMCARSDLCEKFDILDAFLGLKQLKSIEICQFD